MNQKVITLYKEHYTEEQWDEICSEFETDTDGMVITAVIDLNSVSQDI